MWQRDEIGALAKLATIVARASAEIEIVIKSPVWGRA
jgi:hypothetical protein